MLTIFTIPKPFVNNLIKTIQTNAIKSWMQLVPKPEIILFGNEIGVAEFAKQYGLVHVPNLECNESETPYLDYMFDYAERNALFDTLCYINCDIILFQDMINAIQSIKQTKYLMVGQRWDVDITEYIDFSDSEWAAKLNTFVDTTGALKPSLGSDYFVYKKITPVRMPRFLIGRAGWDNWMIYQFMNRKISVIDGTLSIKDIHQNHDYSHIQNGNQKSYSGKESGYNMNIIKNNRCNLFSPKDSDYVLDKNVLLRRKYSFKEKLYLLYCLHPLIKGIVNLFVYRIMGYIPKRLDRSLIDYKLSELNNQNITDLFSELYIPEDSLYVQSNKTLFFKRKKLARFFLKYCIV